ncbi:hypothetical protein PGQ11_013275 [Apiospora arundinis]|uniref:2EXR domain-containing protein n=1 Tax=Apiospora arundinis TaxID=335852 RepID=A0ABR2HNN8_9PEZI
MEPCRDFSQLPLKLRLAIWEHALQQEASRIVRYDRNYHCVLSFKYLVSSILSVNKEARDMALTFYDVKLPVYPVILEEIPCAMATRASHIDYWKNYLMTDDPHTRDNEQWRRLGPSKESTEWATKKVLNQGARQRVNPASERAWYT